MGCRGASRSGAGGQHASFNAVPPWLLAQCGSAGARLEWQNRAWRCSARKPGAGSPHFDFIPWQHGKDNACLAPRYPGRLLVIHCLLLSIKCWSSSTDVLADFRDRRMLPRLTPLQDRAITLQRSGAATEESRRFPGLIPIAAEISSNRSLGAGSAFRLLFRAGILLWARP